MGKVRNGLTIPQGDARYPQSADLSNYSDPAKGDALVGFARTEAGAAGRTVHDELVAVDKPVGATNWLANNSAIDQATQLQQAFNAGAGKTVVLPPWSILIGSTVTVPANTRVIAPFTRIFNSTTHMTLLTLSSAVYVWGLEVEGAGSSTFNSAGIGISATGTVSNYLSDILLSKVYVHGMGSAGIRFQFVANSRIDERTRIMDCGAYHFLGLSLTNVRVTGCHLKGITTGQHPENPPINSAYNLTFTKGQSNDLAVDPRSVNCVADNNLIEDNPFWQGLDSHCGDNTLFFGNTLRNVAWGISFVPLDAGTQSYFGPKRCKAILNDIQGTNNRAGITCNGAESTDGTTADPAEDCQIWMNTLWNCGPTTLAASGEGAMSVRHTRRLKEGFNSVYKPGNHGLVLYKHNYDFDVGRDTILDPHSAGWGGPSGYLIAQAPQTGIVRPSQLLKEDASAAGDYTYNCVYTVYVLADTGSSIKIEPQESAATGDFAGVVGSSYVELKDPNYKANKDSVRCSSSSALPGTYTTSADFKTITGPANTALGSIFDGVTVAVGDRVMVRHEFGALGASNSWTNNGIHNVLSIGSGSSQYVLRRAPDADTSLKLVPRHFFRVRDGVNNGGTLWGLTNTSVVLGTTLLQYDPVQVLQTKNLTNTGTMTSTPASTQTVTASSAITATGAQVLQISAAGAITLTSVPTIVAGTPGQVVEIFNVGTNAITLQDKSVLSGSLLGLDGGANQTLAPGQVIKTRYMPTLGYWKQVGKVT